MEKFKIDYFKNSCPGKDFPDFKVLTAKECENIRSGLFRKLNLEGDISKLDLTRKIEQLSNSIDNHLNAKSESFSLIKILESNQVFFHDNVYVNWHRYDNIDIMKLKDLVRYFDYIWYPGPDDINIFDESFEWILSVDHGGFISFLQFD